MTNEELVLLYQESNDNSYIEMLYNQNEKLIKSIANKFCKSCEFDDLIQEGFLGLLESAKRWDRTMGCNFVSYAYKVIMSIMQRYIHNSSNVIRIPEHQRIQIIKIKQIIEEYEKYHGHEPTPKQLSQILNIPVQKIEELTSDILLLSVKSSDEVISIEDNSITLGDTFEDPINHMEELENQIQNDQLKEVLWNIIDNLEPMQSTILHERYEHNQSTKDISNMLNITAGTLKNLESRAFRELRKHNNRAKLKPFFDESELFSISIKYAGYSYFKNTWTSSPERAVLLYEDMSEKKK